jgi:type IV secretory pathway VirB2 component (pilin)
MRMKKGKILLFLILLPEISFGFCGYYGFGGSKTLMTGVDTSELSIGIPQLINNIREFITECLLIPALILIIIASGVYIIISLGNPARVEMGKKILLAGIIGLIIIFVAQEIVNVIWK